LLGNEANNIDPKVAFIRPLNKVEFTVAINNKKVYKNTKVDNWT